MKWRQGYSASIEQGTCRSGDGGRDPIADPKCAIPGILNRRDAAVAVSQMRQGRASQTLDDGDLPIQRHAALIRRLKVLRTDPECQLLPEIAAAGLHRHGQS